jgi:hypothetical protein
MVAPIIAREAGGGMAKARQALILIHGIGEQRPMETLRSFVDAVLDQSPSTSQADAKYYSKPDMLADNLELRRLVSGRGRDDRTDFYEYYWAHLMPIAPWDRLISWYWVLMARHPKNIPAPVMPLYVLSWLLFVGVFGLGASLARGFLRSDPVYNLPWLIIAIVGILSTLIRSYIGDAAVYLSASPRNIEARQKIRASGLALFDKLVSSGRYDRIIIVGHSLGAVIGYDILTFAWQRHSEAVRARISGAWAAGELPRRNSDAIQAAEKTAKVIRDITNPNAEQMTAFAADWRQTTHAVHAEQLSNGDGWLVTDFVTMGSPLTHGALLLAKDRADFERRARERELPHCPPVRELNGKFSFEHKDLDNQGRLQHAIVLNHAAVFAVTGWTNLFFPCRFILKGDLIGGPTAPLFWPGVRDVEVRTNIWRGWLAHTHYWQRDKRDRDPETAPVAQLRDALDLGRAQT